MLTLNVEVGLKFTSDLYYRKSEESNAKHYFLMTDDYSNCEATIYRGVAFLQLKILLIKILTSHSLYYLKLSASGTK